MKRLAGILLVLIAAAGAAIASAGSSASGSSAYRFDAIFDTAKGIIPGELVKIAGARVGTITGVKLARNAQGTYQARIQMSIDGRFAPFHRDATCEIKPEGLIAENFVQCTPGTTSAPALAGGGGEPPTVPVGRTSVPVNLLDLFNIFETPVSDRLQLVTAELGIGLAGRGADVNAIIRRANPTLALTRQAVSILNRQRVQIQGIVTDSDKVIGELARRRTTVQAFVTHAARVSTQTAEHRGALADAIRRLPPLLNATGPALEQLDQVVTNGTPVLADVQRAGPSVRHLLTNLPTFADAAIPAFRQLGTVAAKGQQTAKTDRPLIGQLRQFAHTALPRSQQLDELMVNLRRTGFWEGLLDVAYYGSAASARFDATSHVLPAHVNLTNCGLYATTPVAGCSANYSQPSSGASSSSALQGLTSYLVKK